MFSFVSEPEIKVDETNEPSEKLKVNPEEPRYQPAAAHQPRFDPDPIPLMAERLWFASEQTSAPGSESLFLWRRHVKDVEYQVALLNTPSSADDDMDTASLRTAMEMKSDLIPAVYEGGLKTWEGALDLVAFLENRKLVRELVRSREHVRVLELGCGSGLPGIYCLRQGVSQVVFQDYNREILSLLTIPNILLNMMQLEPDGSDPNEPFIEVDAKLNDIEMHPVEFYCGDWQTLPAVIAAKDAHTSPRYDLILTSETLYNPNAYAKLLHVFESTLSFPDGVALVASKRYYFGCGGSTADFIQFVHGHAQPRVEPENGNSYRLCVDIVAELDQKGSHHGSAVPREILQVSWTKSTAE